MKIFKNKLLLSVLFVLIVIIIPSFIFSIYQYSNITSEEQVIDDVYKNQLESILFSINQYSVDVVNSWVNDLNKIDYSVPDDNRLNEIINQNDVIKQLNVVNSLLTGNSSVVVSKLDNSKIINDFIRNYIVTHYEEISNLSSLLKSDYQKVIGIESETIPEYSFLIFIIKSGNESLVGILTIHTEQFIQDYLSPKTQQIAENKMNILVYQRLQNKIVYSNENVSDLKDIQNSKELWLFPNYNIGIILAGSTLNNLVKKRVHTVLFLVILFNLLIILGIGLLYYNIKRELELAKLKNEFVSNVSHELRTPLAMISMYSETLLLGRIKNEGKRQEYYEIIQEETNRLNGIVNNILNFSRIENNRRKYSFADENLNVIIEDILKVYKYELDHKGFTYTFDPDETLGPVLVDYEAVKDSIINLISNSIKYSNDQKQIEIFTGIEEDYQYIEVRDKGIGISEKDQEMIFDKFYRVSEENLAYKAQGSGLGLSIVKHIMDAHKGKIIVKSKLNQGSSFKLLFPVKK